MKTSKVIIIGDSIGMPYGYAPTSRTKCLALAISNSGIEVEIVLVKPSEFQGQEANKESKGSIEEIPYTYSGGDAVYSSNKIIRRIQEFKGLFLACVKIAKESRRNPGLVVLAYTRQITTLFALKGIGVLFNFPIALELCEWPLTQPSSNWFGKFRKKLFCKYCLKITDGTIVISKYIEDVVRKVSFDNKTNNPVIKIPILSDKSEFVEPKDASKSNNEPCQRYLLYCGNLSYKQTVNFLLDTFYFVTKDYKDIKLIVVGGTSDFGLIEQYKQKIKELKIENKVEVKGFIPRNELLELYTNTTALVIPMFDDALSKARFPTKLAEYLFTSKPVITTSVGEIAKFLNSETCFLAKDESRDAFVDAIIRCLSNTELAISIGNKGREFAEKTFDYRSYSESLTAWLAYVLENFAHKSI